MDSDGGRNGRQEEGGRGNGGTKSDHEREHSTASTGREAAKERLINKRRKAVAAEAEAAKERETEEEEAAEMSSDSSGSDSDEDETMESDTGKDE